MLSVGCLGERLVVFVRIRIVSYSFRYRSKVSDGSIFVDKVQRCAMKLTVKVLHSDNEGVIHIIF